MKINHNIAAIRTLNELGKVNDKASQSMMRLSSGLRINSASDDAAGLAIANKMDAQIRGLRQANRNTMDGVSMVQTAEGALNETHAILQRMRELTVQAGGVTTEVDREQIQVEINELTEEINRISETTEFNKKSLLKGDSTVDGYAKIQLQVGTNKDQTMDVEIGNMSADALGLTGLPGEEGYDDEATVASGVDAEATRAALDVVSKDNLVNVVNKIDAAIERVSSQRSKLGAVQNRLEHTVTNLGVSEENLTASKSRIQDADMAYEMAQYTQQNVISQAATAMLAQANQRPQQVLQILQ